MLLRRMNGSLGRVLVALGFLLALLGVTTPAPAINIIFQYDQTIDNHPDSDQIKQIIEEGVRAYNEGFTGDITIPFKFRACSGTCGDCLAKSSTKIETFPYIDVRTSVSVQVCGGADAAHDGCPDSVTHGDVWDCQCPNPTPDASERDLQAFRSGMWPPTHLNPVNDSAGLTLTKSNARVFGAGTLLQPDSSGDEYMVMCSDENDSWCTAGTGHFQAQRFTHIPEGPDSLISFNVPCFTEFGGSDGHLENSLDHELAEALGLGSGCNATSNPSDDWCESHPRMQDMFRFYSDHDNVTPRRSYSVSDKSWVYFSTDNGQSPVLGSGLGPYFNTNQGGDCVGGDYGDWYSCPGGPAVARDQDAFEYGDPSVGGVSWIALDVQGYTLADASSHEGGEVMPSALTPVSTAQTEGAVSHFQIRGKRSDARCRLRQAARALFNPDAGDVTQCDSRFMSQIRRLARRVGEFPGYGEIGYHMYHNDQWVQALHDSLGTEPRGSNAICARRVLRVVSRHLRCEGRAQLVELRRGAGKGSRIRDRCDRRFTRKLNRLAKHPEPAACTALIDAAALIEDSRNGFRGDAVEPQSEIAQ